MPNDGQPHRWARTNTVKAGVFTGFNVENRLQRFADLGCRDALRWLQRSRSSTLARGGTPGSPTPPGGSMRTSVTGGTSVDRGQCRCVANCIREYVRTRDSVFRNVEDNFRQSSHRPFFDRVAWRDSLCVTLNRKLSTTRQNRTPSRRVQSRHAACCLRQRLPRPAWPLATLHEPRAINPAAMNARRRMTSWWSPRDRTPDRSSSHRI